ncbi:LCP family protein [Cohnella sp. AR92]|uniref:LCP family protein n=1 Tax=Cohnella sp. AR92 TaxID=648716 RepID=UPI000F8EADA6|nr:LCP family protein [Cohnella sp. AR92]RUS42221.1 LytR family transcriptional regulator [Cohnella sp. AR92]
MSEASLGSRVQKRKNKRKKRILAIGCCILLLLAAGVYLLRKEIGWFVFDHVVSPGIEKTLDNAYEPLPGREVPTASGSKPYAVLLLGVDQRKQEKGRSDTMIYTVVRPKEKKLFMVSIPRDSYAKIMGTSRKKEYYDKITHAYAHGGAYSSVTTVEELLANRVDYYAAINFKGVEETVDSLGGLRLPIAKDLVNDDADHEKFLIKGGQKLYDGKDSLNYVRYREDAGGDINRTHRQVEFIHAAISRMIELNNLTKIPDIMNSLGDTLKTDMPPSEIMDNAKTFFEHGDNFIDSYTLPGTGGKRDDGIYYYNLDEDALNKVKAEIGLWLDPNTSLAELETGLDQTPTT